MNLKEIKSGDVVTLDTNILVYANQQQSHESKELLERCARVDVAGIVPMPMVAELMHTLMLIEARENGWITGANPSRVLAEKPHLVQRLTNYEKQMHEFLGIGFRLESVTHLDFVESLSIQREFGLLTNDSLLLAVARRLNCANIASADKAFQGLRGFSVYTPSDLAM